MTVHRVMGIETEYGILDSSGRVKNPMLLSSQVVQTYSSILERTRRSRWDYQSEDPLHDARGHRLPRASAHPSLLTDDPLRPAPAGPTSVDVDHPGSGSVQTTAIPRPSTLVYDDPGTVNIVLTNGGRLYVDHAHPEYSSPEVLTPLEGVRWDRAGELIMQASAAAMVADPDVADLALYKNNTDGKGASYGCHENFLVRREVPFERIVMGLTTFLVTRQIIVGAGRVGIGQRGEIDGFQISQRADFMEAEVGLETTLRRPIVNTRDEPHADSARWRRLHLIIGDANMFEVATWLKLGMTSALLHVLEQADEDVLDKLEALTLADPVSAVQRVSKDLKLVRPLKLKNGELKTALELQQEILDIIRDCVGEPDDDTVAVLERWQGILTRLGEDPMSCSRDVEWVAKYRLLNRLRERHNLNWKHPRLAAFDLQWSDLDPVRSLYQRLVNANAVDLLVTADEAAAAVSDAPESTRAYFRGTVMDKYNAEIQAASWESVVFDLVEEEQLVRISMPDPYKGTRAIVGEILDNAATASDLVEALAAGPPEL